MFVLAFEGEVVLGEDFGYFFHEPDFAGAGAYAAFAAFVGFLAGGVTGISKADTFSDIVF